MQQRAHPGMVPLPLCCCGKHLGPDQDCREAKRSCSLGLMTYLLSGSGPILSQSYGPSPPGFMVLSVPRALAGPCEGSTGHSMRTNSEVRSICIAVLAFTPLAQRLPCPELASSILNLPNTLHVMVPGERWPQETSFSLPRSAPPSPCNWEAFSIRGSNHLASLSQKKESHLGHTLNTL